MSRERGCQRTKTLFPAAKARIGAVVQMDRGRQESILGISPDVEVWASRDIG